MSEFLKVKDLIDWVPQGWINNAYNLWDHVCSRCQFVMANKSAWGVPIIYKQSYTWTSFTACLRWIKSPSWPQATFQDLDKYLKDLEWAPIIPIPTQTCPFEGDI